MTDDERYDYNYGHKAKTWQLELVEDASKISLHRSILPEEHEAFFPYPNDCSDFSCEEGVDGKMQFVLYGSVGYQEARVLIGEELLDEMHECLTEWRKEDENEQA